MRRQRGYSAIEVVVALAIFALLIVILVGLERELIRFDRQMRVNFFTHPQPMSVVARVRRDVLDSRGYPATFLTYKQTPSLLILDISRADGKNRTAIYDFSIPNMARRTEYVDADLASQWTAQAVPPFLIDSFELPNGKTAVRLMARDDKGRLAIDEIFAPRAES